VVYHTLNHNREEDTMRPLSLRLGLCLVVVALQFPISAFCQPAAADENRYTRARQAMVKSQIQARGITDPQVLDALQRVKRHLFVPPAHRPMAYEDTPLPIGSGQTISQPYIVALMTEILKPDKHKTVLEIGTGSGYQAAVLAELFKQVYTIEIVPELGRRADNLLKSLKYDNIKVKVGDGYKGWATHSPFDAIIVTCAPTHSPQPLQEQLAEGGKMIIPVGERHDQRLVLLIKKDGRIQQSNVIPVRFVPMVRKNGKTY
jgi:protein-L-isoaspartate(D-aspartate) O-methyltransferase